MENSTTLRSGITIFPSHDKALDQVLTDLAEKVPAQFVMLIDITGQFISARGDRGQIDLVALGSLIAGDLAASQEIARLMGQYQSYQLILREGQKVNTFISEAGRHLVLLVQIPADVPLGWARILIQEASCKLADVVATPVVALNKLDLGLGEEKLSDLVGDALDSLWTG